MIPLSFNCFFCFQFSYFFILLFPIFFFLLAFIVNSLFFYCSQVLYTPMLVHIQSLRICQNFLLWHLLTHVSCAQWFLFVFLPFALQQLSDCLCPVSLKGLVFPETFSCWLPCNCSYLLGSGRLWFGSFSGFSSYC